MKIYVVNGRKVWLDKAPEGAEEVKPVIKAEEPKAEEATAEVKAKPETANKARKAPANKRRRGSKNE